MAKSTNGTKIDKLEFPKLGIVIDIRFDKSNGRFNGEYQGKTITSTTLAEVKELLKAEVNNNTNILWKPILQIRFHQTSDQDGGVGWMLNTKRFYAYLNPNPQKEGRPWMRCDWDAPEDKRLGWARVEEWMWKPELPYVRKGSYGEKNSEVFMDYDQELWEQLTIVKDGMRHFRDALQTPLLDAENLPRLPVVLTRFMDALQIMYPSGTAPEPKLPVTPPSGSNDMLATMKTWFWGQVDAGRDPEDIFADARSFVDDDLWMEVEAYKATHKG